MTSEYGIEIENRFKNNDLEKHIATNSNKVYFQIKSDLDIDKEYQSKLIFIGTEKSHSLYNENYVHM